MFYALQRQTPTVGDFETRIRANEQALEDQDRAAKEAGVLEGRVIRHQYADSYAVYQVIRASARTATIRVCTGLGDDWVLPAWGEEATVPRKVVQGFIDRADALDRLFARKVG